MNLLNKIKYGYLAKAYYLMHTSPVLKPLAMFYRNTERALRKRKTEAFYSEFLRKNDLCFDIGANVGNRAEIFLNLGCRVIAVEPQKNCTEAMGKKFAGKPELVIIQKAIDEKRGKKELIVCPVDYNSSMSEEWISALRTSGRCQSFEWNQRLTVETTTLDELIALYGIPRYCKIDVEGYELPVLKGLSHQIPFISFEFTQECLGQTAECIKQLSKIGNPMFNFSYGESMSLVLKNPVTTEEMIRLLSEIKPRTSGDIYAQFKN